MNIVQSVIVSIALTAASFASVTAFAQAGMDYSKMGSMKMDMSQDMTEGEVHNVDKSAGKVTIKHGDIKHLNMPGMTMAFPVKDTSLLDKVKTGDKIKFKLVREGKKVVITDLQNAP